MINPKIIITVYILLCSLSFIGLWKRLIGLNPFGTTLAGTITFGLLISGMLGLIFISWALDVKGNLREHNRLYKCKKCDKFFRKYQLQPSGNKCPQCGHNKTDFVSSNFEEVEETYEWMDYHPDFMAHDFKQYKQFKELGELIDQQAYERRSTEMFMKYWGNAEQNKKLEEFK